LVDGGGVIPRMCHETILLQAIAYLQVAFCMENVTSF
jgi:hypothetical protein